MEKFLHLMNQIPEFFHYRITIQDTKRVSTLFMFCVINVTFGFAWIFIKLLGGIL